jgi:hypothetical protein
MQEIYLKVANGEMSRDDLEKYFLENVEFF